MLKYVDTMVTFREVPDEITLAINISNCPCHCEGCHSSYLAEDIGEELNDLALNRLLIKNQGITCVAFMGGDSDPSEINEFARKLKVHTNLKVAWYSGRQELSKDIELKNFDFVKLGPYIEELGPLNSKTTNQRFYEVLPPSITNSDSYKLLDITNKFLKHETKN